MDEALASHAGGGLNLVISLAVPDEVILERIEGQSPLLPVGRGRVLTASLRSQERWVHPSSGRIYNVSTVEAAPNVSCDSHPYSSGRNPSTLPKLRAKTTSLGSH
mgnify:FL=1